MQTNENTSNRKTFAIGLIGGLGLAAALGAAFLLGGRAGSANPGPQARVQAPAIGLAATTGAPATSDAPVVQTDPQDHQADAPADGGGTQPDQASDAPAIDPTATPQPEEPADTEDDDPTVTPTVTPEPGDGCLYCLDDPDIVLPLPTQTPHDPCAYCLNTGLVFPLDVTPPTISNVETEFCYPVLTVSLEVDAPAEVWFEYEYDGNDYESIHEDAANDASLPEDMDSFGWGVYLIDTIDIHAVDLAGNHAVTTVDMPGPFDC